MKGGVILDTNILIDYLRGSKESAKFLESFQDILCVSAMTVAELYAGARNDRERSGLDQFVEAFSVLPVNKTISKKGGAYRRKYGKSHNVDLIDALIAATAVMNEMTLFTLNKKHFPMLRKVSLPYK
jgi:predicted nucleic acid-binding protein